MMPPPSLLMWTHTGTCVGLVFFLWTVALSVLAQPWLTHKHEAQRSQNVSSFFICIPIIWNYYFFPPHDLALMCPDVLYSFGLRTRWFRSFWGRYLPLNVAVFYYLTHVQSLAEHPKLFMLWAKNEKYAQMRDLVCRCIYMTLFCSLKELLMQGDSDLRQLRKQKSCLFIQIII